MRSGLSCHHRMIVPENGPVNKNCLFLSTLEDGDSPVREFMIALPEFMLFHTLWSSQKSHVKPRRQACQKPSSPLSPTTLKMQLYVTFCNLKP